MISIRPEVAMYAAFARLNYKPWYALAEFVDNSLQSALSKIDALRHVDGADYQLQVDIVIGPEAIEIRDNAAGIAFGDYTRAFLPAAPPPDTSGLSEFGLGMKAAASWFSERWTVRTTALDEDVERTLVFDIPSIVHTKTDELQPSERRVSRALHYTTLRLEDLRVHPKGRTLNKISTHLASIYRKFIDDGFLRLTINGDALTYERPKFLVAPFYETPSGSSVTWKKDFELDLGDGHKIAGWAGILSRASVANAGFAVFRRRRLVIGSQGEGYRPELIFGKPNKFVYQRLVGELEVEGFSVSHTKDGIQWSDWEDDIIVWLKSELDSDPLPLIRQATHFRARPPMGRNVCWEAIQDTSSAVAQHLGPIVDAQLSYEPSEEPLAEKLDEEVQNRTTSKVVSLSLHHARVTWQVSIEIASDPKQEGWYELAEISEGPQLVLLEIRLNLAHPFVERFVSPSGDEVVLFTRLATGLAIAEVTSRKIGVRHAGQIRTNLNDILRNGLAGPIKSGGDG